MKNFKKIIVIPLHEIIENIYKLLSHAPGFQSHGVSFSSVSKNNTSYAAKAFAWGDTYN